MSTIAFYTGASAMRAFQSKMDVVAHNLANVQTNGYKARRASFQDTLYSRMNTNVPGEHLVGHGVKQEYIDQIMVQAGLDQTSLPLDFALVGDGFFQVQSADGLEYTRNGAFYLSIEAGGPTLVTSDGAYVLDRAGGHITLNVNPDGSYNTENLTQRIGVHTFPNQWGLEPRNNARYIQSANSGAPQLQIPGAPGGTEPLTLIQGSLEFSGVDVGNEMVEVIMAQRAFQLSSRIVTTADEIAQEINNLR